MKTAQFVTLIYVLFALTSFGEETKSFILHDDRIVRINLQFDPNSDRLAIFCTPVLFKAGDTLFSSECFCKVGHFDSGLSSLSINERLEDKETKFITTGAVTHSISVGYPI
jgi:hypothetical protein